MTMENIDKDSSCREPRARCMGLPTWAFSPLFSWIIIVLFIFKIVQICYIIVFVSFFIEPKDGNDNKCVLWALVIRFPLLKIHSDWETADFITYRFHRHITPLQYNDDICQVVLHLCFDYKMYVQMYMYLKYKCTLPVQ